MNNDHYVMFGLPNVTLIVVRMVYYRWYIMAIAGAGTRDTEPTAGTEGGELLPALLMGAGALMGGIYSVGQAVENNRYWNDYYRNTGFRPRYPFRAGMYDWMQSAGASLTDFGLAYNFNRKAFRRYSYRRYYR